MLYIPMIVHDTTMGRISIRLCGSQQTLGLGYNLECISAKKRLIIFVLVRLQAQKFMWNHFRPLK
jgi:hypothetical protein